MNCEQFKLILNFWLLTLHCQVIQFVLDHFTHKKKKEKRKEKLFVGMENYVNLKLVNISCFSGKAHLQNISRCIVNEILKHQCLEPSFGFIFPQSYTDLLKFTIAPSTVALQFNWSIKCFLLVTVCFCSILLCIKQANDLTMLNTVTSLLLILKCITTPFP